MIVDTPEKLDAPWELPFDPLVCERDVYNCFRLVLGRNPSRHEWPGHTGAYIGKPLDSVVSVYLDSPEFKARKLVRYSLDDVEYVELEGYGMYVSRDDLAVGIQIRTRREYEPDLTQAFREVLRPGMRVVDVGANIGWFSCLSAQLVGPTGRVVAVEAGETNVKFLMMSRMRNAWPQLTILGAAASDRVETLLYSANSSNGFVRAPQDVEEIAAGSPVPAVALSAVLEDGKPWHLVKIDVEGYELKALHGLEPTIARHRPVLAVEFCPPAIANVSGVGADSFLRWFTERGYSLDVLSGGRRVACGRDIGKVMSVYESAKSDHVDLFATA